MPAVMPLLMLVVLLGVFPIDVLLASIPSMSQHFGVGTQLLVANVGLFPVGVAVAQLIVGVASDRYGRRSLLLVSLGMAVFGGLGSAFASSFTEFNVWRALQGFGCGGLVLVHALVQDLFPDCQRTRQRIALNTAGGLFISLSPLAGVMLEAQFGWRASFWVFAGLCGLAALLAVKILPGGMPAKAAEWPKTNVTLANKASFVCAASLATLLFTVHFSFILLSPLIFLEQLDGGATAYGLAMLAYGGAYLGGGLIACRVADRYTETLQMSLAVGLIVLAGIWMVLIHSLVGMTSFSVLSGGCLMVAGVTLGRPAAITVAMNSMPGKAGLAAAMLNALMFIGGGSLSALFGLFADHSLWLLPSVLLALGALGCSLILHPSLRRSRGAPLTVPAPAKR